MKVTSLAALAVGFAMLFGGSAHAAVYTETNSQSGNAVYRLDRAADGSLSVVPWDRTGGLGTGAGLGPPGAGGVRDDGETLVAVDAGSNDIAAFHVTRHGHLTLIAREPSGGTMPVSVDIADGRVYVLNAGGQANVTAFDVNRAGLRPRGAANLNPGALGAAQ